MRFLVLVLGFLSLFLFACNDKSDDQVISTLKNNVVSGKNVISDKNINLAKNSIAGNLNELSYLYLDGNKLVYQDNDNSHVIGENISKFWLKKQGQHVYVFYWLKFIYGNKDGKDNQLIRGKTLYVKASHDGGKTFAEKVQVNDGEGVLPEIKIAADDKGNIAVLYLDERFPGYQVYFNASKDGGITWLKEDIMLNKQAKNILDKSQRTEAVDPSLGKMGNKLIAIWQDKQIVDDKTVISRFLSRESNDFGQTWGEEVVIYQQKNMSSTEIATFIDDQGAYLMAAFNKGVNKGLKVFSKKGNHSWQDIEGLSPGTNKGKLVSYIKTAATEKTLYISYVFVNKFSIWHTELVRLNRITDNWYPDAYRFDNSLDGVANEQKGSYQDVAVLSDGTVIVAWEDYRGILPAVFMNYSKDDGETWLVDPIPMVRVGAEQAFMPFIISEQNKFKLFFTLSDLPEGTRPTVKTVVTSLDSPKSPDFSQYKFYQYKRPSEEESRKQIMRRAKKLLDARVKQDWDTEWKFMDPLYRNLYSKNSWLQSRGQLKFKSFKLNDIVFTRGVYARVAGEATFDFTDKVKSLKDIPEDQKKDVKQALGMRWGWFYDNWYFIPETGMQERHID